MLNGTADADALTKFSEILPDCITEGYVMTDQLAFCQDYIMVFNQGIHYSFIASVAAMLISLIVFICTKKMYPQPGKKEKSAAAEYTAEEKQAMAKEIGRGNPQACF